jgi:hypothetical protein
MPTWGPLFKSVSSQDQTVVNMRISNLTNYVKSLQGKQQPTTQKENGRP